MANHEHLIESARIMQGDTGFTIQHDGRGDRVIRVHDGGKARSFHEREIDSMEASCTLDAIQSLHSLLMVTIREAADRAEGEKPETKA